MISLVLVFIESLSHQILYHGEQIDKDCVGTFILKIISKMINVTNTLIIDGMINVTNILTTVIIS